MISSGAGAGGFNQEDVSMFCNKSLPARKPKADPGTEVAGKIFILSMPGPQLPPDQAMENICCRFGGLIDFNWLPSEL